MGIENLAEDLLNEPEEEKKSSALRAPPLGKEEKEKKEPKISGSIEDDIFEGIRAVDEEMRQLEQNITESKKAKLGALAGFQEELSAARKELKEWGKLLKLVRKKRKPTFAEAAALKEARLAAIDKAAEAAKGAGVENLESVEEALREAEEAIQEYEPLDTMKAQTSAFQAEGMALREKQRLLTEAWFWLKKAMIIQSLLEVKTPTASETSALGGSQPKNSKIFERKGESLERSTAEMNYVEVIKPESELEERILRDPEWQQGAEWGESRPGHPEGKNIFHVAEVLRNIDKLRDINAEERARLRFVAFVHDSFKYRVDTGKRKVGENQHGRFAEHFAERYTDDSVVLRIIRLHDDAYNAWRYGENHGDLRKAEWRLNKLISDLGKENLRLFLLFFKCDNETGMKEPTSVRWFEDCMKEWGLI